LLTIFTKFLGVLHFSYFGRNKEKSDRESKEGNKDTKAKVVKDNSSPDSDRQEIRQRMADINRELYLIGPFSDYLTRFYLINSKEALENLMDTFYPEDHFKREEIKQDFEALTFDDKQQRYEFIEKWFVKPITYFWFMVITLQHDRWDNYTKGKLKPEEINYPPFRDQDFRRLVEFLKANDIENMEFTENNDPMLKFNLTEIMHFTLEIAKEYEKLIGRQENLKKEIDDIEKKIGSSKEPDVVFVIKTWNFIVNLPNRFKNFLKKLFQDKNLNKKNSQQQKDEKQKQKDKKL
jgi:hypothetical protein